MIRTEAEYKKAVELLREEADRIREKEVSLSEESYSPEEVKRLLDPERSFREQLSEEVESYERLCRGEFEEIRNFEGIGRLFIALRIASGITQRELAKQLGVDESQVSRDERNEYHAITVPRMMAILKCLGVEVKTSVVVPPPRKGTGNPGVVAST